MVTKIKGHAMLNKCYLMLISAIMIALTSTASAETRITPVSPFNLDQYLGKWYEIARIDFFFERGLDNTTAEYSLNDNGSVRVVNRGYNKDKKKWKDAKGKAKFVGDTNVGALKVSFFGPFYGGYNVIALEENYQYALVAGDDESNLWILSREKTIPDEIKEKYLKIAEQAGYDVSDLLWIAHDL